MFSDPSVTVSVKFWVNGTDVLTRGRSVFVAFNLSNHSPVPSVVVQVMTFSPSPPVTVPLSDTFRLLQKESYKLASKFGLNLNTSVDRSRWSIRSYKLLERALNRNEKVEQMMFEESFGLTFWHGPEPTFKQEETREVIKIHVGEHEHPHDKDGLHTHTDLPDPSGPPREQPWPAGYPPTSTQPHPPKGDSALRVKRCFRGRGQTTGLPVSCGEPLEKWCACL